MPEIQIKATLCKSPADTCSSCYNCLLKLQPLINAGQEPTTIKASRMRDAKFVMALTPEQRKSIDAHLAGVKTPAEKRVLLKTLLPFDVSPNNEEIVYAVKEEIISYLASLGDSNERNVLIPVCVQEVVVEAKLPRLMTDADRKGAEKNLRTIANCSCAGHRYVGARLEEVQVTTTLPALQAVPEFQFGSMKKSMIAPCDEPVILPRNLFKGFSGLKNQVNNVKQRAIQRMSGIPNAFVSTMLSFFYWTALFNFLCDEYVVTRESSKRIAGFVGRLKLNLFSPSKEDINAFIEALKEVTLSDINLTSQPNYFPKEVTNKTGLNSAGIAPAWFCQLYVRWEDKNDLFEKVKRGTITSANAGSKFPPTKSIIEAYFGLKKKAPKDSDFSSNILDFVNRLKTEQGVKGNRVKVELTDHKKRALAKKLKVLEEREPGWLKQANKWIISSDLSVWSPFIKFGDLNEPIRRANGLNEGNNLMFIATSYYASFPTLKPEVRRYLLDKNEPFDLKVHKLQTSGEDLTKFNQVSNKKKASSNAGNAAPKKVPGPNKGNQNPPSVAANAETLQNRFRPKPCKNGERCEYHKNGRCFSLHNGKADCPPPLSFFKERVQVPVSPSPPADTFAGIVELGRAILSALQPPNKGPSEEERFRAALAAYRGV